MPWIVPSHQAPVLPLKRWRPDWFSGLGLVLGTMAPDLVFVFGLDENGSVVSHTLLGQFYLTVPIVLALHALATIVVWPWLLPRVAGGAPLYLHALARSRPATSPAALLRLALSGVIGGLSHIAIDGFTHGNQSGWAVRLLPFLATPLAAPGGPVPLHDVLQVVLTILLGASALASWQRIAKAQPTPGPGAAARWEVRPAPPAQRTLVLGLLLAAAVLGALGAPLLKGGFGTPYALKLAGYGVLTFTALAVVLAALADRLRRVLARVREDLRVVLET